MNPRTLSHELLRNFATALLTLAVIWAAAAMFAWALP
jgi:hypothetical protein